MPNTTHAAHAQPQDAGVTLTLSAQQLKALGLNTLPAQGAEVRLSATVTVAHPDDTDNVPDADHDAAADAAGGDDDGDEAGQAGASGALTLNVTGLTLIHARKAPDQVLYGSGD